MAVKCRPLTDRSNLGALNTMPKGHINRVRTVMGNLEQSWNFKMVISRPGKVMEKTLIIKVMEICYRMFIYAEFEIINVFFKKERCSKYKPAYALLRQMFSMVHVYTENSVWSWKFGLKSWKSIGQRVRRVTEEYFGTVFREF